MSEFSPDTIQFGAAAEASPEDSCNTPQSALYRALTHWIEQNPSPIWKQWLEQQIQQEALRNFFDDLQLPLSLDNLSHQLRALHDQISVAIPHADVLRQLLYNWQKQSEALSLNNPSAYEKTSEERQFLKTRLAETEWPASFMKQCHHIEQFLAQQAEARLKLIAPAQALLAPSPPEVSIPLMRTDSDFLLPSHLKTKIFQRSPQAWLRRAARYLQIAWQSNFSDKSTLKSLLKSLYAALEQDPQNTSALLLLGWMFAGMGNTHAAMACLERLREHESHPEMIFLIRFLQNRPVL